mgnify:CR=1 FL=1
MGAYRGRIVNKRRKLLLALGGSALASPLPSIAQPATKVWRVGFLALFARPVSIESIYIGAFPRGLRELGYVEGRNLVIEWRFAEGKLDRLPALAAGVVPCISAALAVPVVGVGLTRPGGHNPSPWPLEVCLP